MEADIEAASVQHFLENYLSMCRQRIRYQSRDHTLQHTCIIDIHIYKTMGRSLVQAIGRRAEDLSRTQAIRICGGQNGNGTCFL